MHVNKCLLYKGLHPTYLFLILPTLSVLVGTS